MNDHDFETRLTDLVAQISSLPEGEQAPLAQMAEEAKGRHEQMNRTVSQLQESLDYLRLSVKYLVFDLEATRRENQYLRQLLEQQTGGEE